MDTEYGKIQAFTIQLSYEQGKKQVEVYRADTHHGYLHEHRFWESGEPIRLEEAFTDYNQAYQTLFEHVRQNAEEWISERRKKRHEQTGPH